MNHRDIYRISAALALALLAAYGGLGEGWAAGATADDSSRSPSGASGVCAVALGAPFCVKPGAGESFRDCPHCPEMVIVPAGSFMMGSSGKEPEPFTGQSPVHRVTIASSFAIGKFPVTFAEWEACLDDGGCGGHMPSDEGWGGGDRPAINVSWDDAKAYAKWLSRKTGQRYRLLSEAEFEYAARAGTSTLFWWGDSISPTQANYDSNHSYADGPKGPYRRKTLPVQSFEPNPWGLYQVHGNVATWTEDCWVDNYFGAPRDGSARKTGNCMFRVTRGGSWYDYPKTLRVAVRIIAEPRLRKNDLGFRIARDLCGAGSRPLNASRDKVPTPGNRC